MVTGVEDLPSGLTAAPLPDGGVRIGPAGTADLLLRWAGPACTAEVPDRFLPEVALPVLHGDLSTTVTVATAGADPP